MNTSTKVNAKVARLEALNKGMKQVKALGLPNVVVAGIQSPARVASLLKSLEIAKVSPFTVLRDNKGLPMVCPKAVTGLATRFGVKVEKAEDGVAIDAAFDGWAAVGYKPTSADTREVLLAAGAEVNSNGAYRLFNLTFDVDNLAIAGLPVKTILIVNPMGDEAVSALPEEAMFWIVLGAIQGIALSGGKAPQKVVQGYIRVMYATATENGGYGFSDPATVAFTGSKLPVFQLGWCATGYTLKGMTEGDSTQAFLTLAALRPGTGAHAQGKFLVDLDAGALAITRRGNQVVMASTAAAKWFKRLTLGLPLQVRLADADVSYFRTCAGGDHHGRMTQVVLLKDGLNFPYLGNAVSLVSRKAMASHFKGFSVISHTAAWTGSHEVMLPVVGDKVSKGQVLVAGPDPVVATCYGTVYEADTSFEDGITLVSVGVANMDRTGQVKVRSQVFKVSVAYPSWTGTDWESVCEETGLPTPQVFQGDFAIISGLHDGDAPVLVGNQDTVKCQGKGNAAGVVSLAANTLREEVLYRPELHLDGEFDNLVNRFEILSTRKGVVVAYVVLNEIAEAIQTAGRADVVFHPLKDGRYTEIVQTTDAWVATDLLKVESISVRESLTTGYSPLEVAMAANALGLKAGAKMLVAGGETQVNELVALHESVSLNFNMSVYQDLMDEGHENQSACIAAFSIGEVPIAEAGVSIIDVTNISDNIATALLRRAADPLALPKRMVLLDTVRQSGVVIDPVVLKAFGRGDGDSSLKSLFAQCCFNAATGETKVAQGLILQMGGLLRKLAVSPKANKRAFRGAATLQAKTSAGNVPQGWVAFGYNSNVAVTLSKLFGLDSVDNLWGQVVYVYRAPQVAPLPLRVYMPDAPEDVQQMNADVLPGSVLQVPALEPDRFFLSPFDTAYDHGDHDGDGRNLIPVTCWAAKDEALAFDSEALRKKVLATYKVTTSDPVVEAYQQNPDSKLAWAKVGVVSWDEFVQLSADSITNQTKDIGKAYNLAHLALAGYGDRLSSTASGVRAFSFLVGHYEEQLAGLDSTYRDLYQLLGDDSDFRVDENLDVAGYHTALRALNDKLGHTAADGDALIRLSGLLKVPGQIAKGKVPSIEGAELNAAVIGGLVRIISRGSFESDGNLSPLLNAWPALESSDSIVSHMFEKAAEGSVGCYALNRFLTRLFPLMSATEARAKAKAEADANNVD